MLDSLRSLFHRTIGAWLFPGAGGGKWLSEREFRTAFESVLEKRRRGLERYKRALAALIGEEERLRDALSLQEAEAARAAREKQEAVDAARAGIAAASTSPQPGGEGRSESAKPEDDPEYVRRRDAFLAAHAAWTAALARCDRLRPELEEVQRQVERHARRWETLHRGLETLLERKRLLLAEMRSARIEGRLADLLEDAVQERDSAAAAELEDAETLERSAAQVARDLAALDAAPLDPPLGIDAAADLAGAFGLETAAPPPAPRRLETQ